VEGHPRPDREWEHWPGRRQEDPKVRHRLKALFSATDDREAVEAMIADRSREIEEQTERLQATIVDLERREAQASRLRSAVEQMLREGSAELDERHAELAALAVELRAREERVREQEREVAVRRQELGAVELRRAAVERKEEALAEREAALERAEAEQADRGLGPAETGDEAESEPVAPGHILYLAGDGYRLLERDGPAPGLDRPVEVDGTAFVVARVGRSTLPGDRRPCAYLEPARSSSPA